MSKNKYILPMKGLWYVEYGGITKENSHSWDIINQRYAYDFEIRENNLPFHDDCTQCNNYYSFKKTILAPFDGWVVYIENSYNNTKILKNRPVICDVDNSYGNHIIIKHPNNEYSVIAHIEKDSFKVKIGDVVKQGQPIAKVGNSGNTQGPHIHFQIQDNADLYNSKGIIINFKNVFYLKKNKEKKITNINKGIYIKNKKDF